MRILVACEFSGIVRDAFCKMGHEAWSCDIVPTTADSPFHIQRDVLEILNAQWDMLIAFPPCTHLASSGARWWPNKQKEQQEAIEFFMALVNAPVHRIAIENPVGKMSTAYRKPDQIIQPWQFGHGETKSTCLWLKNLKPLEPTNIVEGRQNRIHMMPDSKGRAERRSITYQGIANAMAQQWG